MILWLISYVHDYKDEKKMVNVTIYDKKEYFKLQWS